MVGYRLRLIFIKRLSILCKRFNRNFYFRFLNNLFSAIQEFFGAVSALAVDKKSLLAAFATSDEDISTGNGIVYTTNSTGNSISWKYFYDELIDNVSDSIPTFAGKYFKSLPITAHQANVTYDAAIGENIYGSQVGLAV